MLRTVSQWRTAILSMIVAGLYALAPQVALAHAVLPSSTPGKNSLVAGPDVSVRLTYNSRIDSSHSSLSLKKPDQSIEGISDVRQEGLVTLTATVHGLAKGAYILRWHVLSADGHISRGELPFSVK